MDEIALLIVDDHPLVIEGIQGLLQGQAGIHIAGRAHSVAEAQAFLQEKAAHIRIALIDIRLQDGLGMDLTKEIRQKYPHIQVIGLTMYDSDAYLEAMVQCGARGYLLKNTSREELLKAIDAVLAGRFYFSESMHDVIGQRLATTSKPKARTAQPQSNETHKATKETHLTKRERQILELVAKELTNTQIAVALSLSPRTIHTHRRSIMQKLGVRNTAGLIRYAMEHGILTANSHDSPPENSHTGA
jgi:DNA-binding NarL/FixJ family response regulator